MQIAFKNTIFNKINTANRSNKASISFAGTSNKISDFNTFNTLYSDEFVPKRQFNDDGFRITTIIDKNNNKPVEVAVLPNMNDKDYESYSFLIINDEDPNDYSQVGMRSFAKGEKSGCISSGYMESFKRERYAGCGIREQQITYERMKQLGLKQIEIFSLGHAFPFHYKCGFRPIVTEKGNSIVKEKDINDEINKFSFFYGVPEETVRKNLAYKKDEDVYLLNEQLTKANIALEYYNSNLPVPNNVNVYMELSEDSKSMWDKLIEKEPILK